MKAIIKNFILFTVLTLAAWTAPQKASAQAFISFDFQLFYDDLSPYGDWIDNEEYGYVWLPDVSRGFTPYRTNGHWIYTYAGWTWVSNYSWGWAPFHYGRWFYDPYYGWLWAPDNEWGPGWVTWRRSNDYYGWAPIGPGISINIAYSNGYNLPYNQWMFVRSRDFGRTDINNYYINSSSYTTIINNTTVINNIQVDNSSSVRYNTGPDRSEVQIKTGNNYAPVALREKNSPGQSLNKSELQIYRPRVEKNDGSGRKSAPAMVVDKNDVKPIGQRNTDARPQRGDKQIKQQQPQRNDQQSKQQQPQKIDQQAKQQQQQQQQQRDDQQAKQQQQQRDDQQAKQQQQQRNDQQAKQQQQQRDDQQAKQQEQQRNDQQAKQQQQQRDDQQAKQQQQQQLKDQQAKQQQQQQLKDQQAKQQQQQRKEQQAKQPQPRKEQPVKQPPERKDTTRKGGTK